MLAKRDDSDDDWTTEYDTDTDDTDGEHLSYPSETLRGGDCNGRKGRSRSPRPYRTALPVDGSGWTASDDEVQDSVDCDALQDALA